jgi:hypothetical protein
VLPHVRFNRRIGEHVGAHVAVDGQPVPAQDYPAYLASVLPANADYELLADLTKDSRWIEPKNVKLEN